MDKPLQLNLTEIIKNRVGGWKGKFIPAFLLHRLEKLIRQDGLNEILRIAHPSTGSEFSSKVIEHLDIRLEVKGLENLPMGEPLIFASNHPLGGLDGIALVKVLGEKYGDSKIRVLVNDLLMNVKPLANVFLPVNKFGSQGRRNARLLTEALEDGKQIVMFPAGLVSRLHPDGSIHDLEWQKSFVTKALQFHRRVVPVHFEGLNSLNFYKTARLRKRLNIKINLEQALLPREVFNAAGKTFKITFKAPIDIEALDTEGLKPTQIADKIKEIVYR